jgi:glycosyltransferase involved in cell wall biosynthesis
MLPRVPPTILFVGNYLPGASRPVALDLADALAQAGYSCITTSDRVAQLPRLIDMVATATRRRAEYRAAVVDVYSGRAFLYAEVVCRTLKLLRKPYVLTLHGGNLPAFSAQWPGRVTRLLRGADAVTAPSGYLASAMREHRPDLVEIPNGVDLRRYRFRDRASIRPRLLWLRAFHRIYRPELAVAVLARLRAEFPEMCLTMVGPDKGDGALEATRALAEGLGVLDRVVLPGLIAKSDVPRWMDGADIFVNTSAIDNAPVSVIEAMASGLCIVSTRVGGIPELVRHEREALLTRADAPAMADAVRRLLEDPHLAARLSSGARRRAEASDWSRVVPQWVALLDGLRAA